MKAMDFIELFGGVREEFVLSAGEKLCPTKKKSKKPWRRRLVILVAAVILLLGTATTVVAANPELRALIVSFFKVEEQETIPPATEATQPQETQPGQTLPEEPEPTQPPTVPIITEHSTLSGVITRTYIQAPVQSHANGGALLICTDEVMMNAGNHFDVYRVDEGGLVKLENHDFSQDYEILGNKIHLEFTWADYNGACVISYIDADAPVFFRSNAGPLEATLVHLRLSIPVGDTWESCYYPVLINIRTGELTDVLAGTGASTIGGLQQGAISEDGTKMLLSRDDGTLYYADLEKKLLRDVETLSGEKADACVLAGNSLVCWALTGDSIQPVSFGEYRVWTIDLDTLTREDSFTMEATAFTSHAVWSETYDLYHDAPALWEAWYGGDLPPMTPYGLVELTGFDGSFHGSAMFPGSPYAVAVDGERNVIVIELETGLRYLIQDFTWPEGDYPNVGCIPSPDGRKLLIYVRGADRYYTSVGILDYEAKTYTQFSRENLSELNEHTIYWFDNDHVLIGTGYSGDTREYYLYGLTYRDANAAE